MFRHKLDISLGFEFPYKGLGDLVIFLLAFVKEKRFLAKVGVCIEFPADFVFGEGEPRTECRVPGFQKVKHIDPVAEPLQLLFQQHFLLLSRKMIISVTLFENQPYVEEIITVSLIVVFDVLEYVAALS